jgi:hypothetical protein
MARITGRQVNSYGLITRHYNVEAKPGGVIEMTVARTT